MENNFQDKKTFRFTEQISFYSILNNCEVTLFVSENQTNDEKKFVSRLKNKELSVLIISSKKIPKIIENTFFEVCERREIFVIKSCDFNGNIFFVYFVEEKLPTEIVEKLKSLSSKNAKSQKQYTPPPKKKHFTKSQRKKMNNKK